MVYTDLTQEYLKSILIYNPETGIFTWKITRINVIAGNKAGYVHCGYVNIKIHNKAYKAHRLAWLYMTGQWPKDEIDHINGITYDNSWLNLREATHHENTKNRKLNINNKVRLKGVHKEKNKWRASISINKVQKFLGLFDTPEEASQAYKQAANEHYGNFVRNASYE